ncbi:hypothetical protein FHR32_006231 [Streptosporangium album]|uniref:Heavy metal-binding domain-containing protein n=1 Tax=Streptosporangium album TaxID=47479 RepID=A0A7W7S0U2_9ACTN|nr:hypothetical protein [Streptosporangium album]MBB4941845.1 hypothetical protein [Streptosporangium album]
MNTPAKLGAYALGLAVIFGGALGAGNAVGFTGTPAATDGHLLHATASPGQAADSHGAHAQPAPSRAAAGASIPGGLQVSQDGYTLTPETTTITPGEATDFRFTVTGPDGRPVTGYQVQHDKKLHFIVVSRDLGSFQHLHPEEAGDGVWSVKLTLPEAGAYRAFADFTPEGGTGLTLGTDLHASGDYEPKALPTAGRTANVDGYTVELDGTLVPGASSKLTLKVSKDGRPVTDLQPYLGAYGHLVALRAGDLAYLHVHPDGEPGDGRTPSGPEITFYAEVPSRGDYRLFLDFQHNGTVRTADFTAPAGPATTSGPTPAATPSISASHGDHNH